MGFSNSIIGGAAALIRAAIRSPNFVTGSGGWQISKDGSAEFNNITIRGTFNGTDFILNATGLFFYSGTPAAGTLIMSIVPGTGSVNDPFGTGCPPGVTVGKNTSPQVEMLTAGTSGVLRFLMNNAGFTNPQIFANTPGGTFASFVMGGPANAIAGHTDAVGVLLNSSDGGSSANLEITYDDANGTGHVTAFSDFSGFNIVAGTIDAVAPGTGTGPTNASAAETWHAMAAFNAGFSHGVPAPAYKLNADNTVSLAGQVSATSGTTSGTIITLPSASYFPALAKTFPLPFAGGTPAATGNCRLGVSTGGALNLAGGPTGAPFTFNLDGIRYPLDS